MRHMLDSENLAICTTRSVEIGRGFEHAFCARGVIQHHTVSIKEVNFIFPLYILQHPQDLGFEVSRQANISKSYAEALRMSLDLKPYGGTGLPAAVQPEDVIQQIYAILHSPTYRTRYAEFLKIDFPRIPLTSSLDLFRALAKLGGELVALHLLESPRLNQAMTDFIGDASRPIEKVTYSDGTVWIDKAKTTGFRGASEDVWKFHIGGYQVCEKWLKDRGPKKGKPGRVLSAEDIAHYHKIVVALSETIRLMAQIDQVIEQHGGWPGAFAGSKESATAK